MDDDNLELEPSARQCRTIDEVRSAIDRIDREIVRLMGRRKAYVRAAAHFKTSERDVRAPTRFAAMLQTRRQWAEDDGLDPAMIEALFREMVTRFIEQELQDWAQRVPDA